MMMCIKDLTINSDVTTAVLKESFFSGDEKNNYSTSNSVVINF